MLKKIFFVLIKLSLFFLIVFSYRSNNVFAQSGQLEVVGKIKDNNIAYEVRAELLRSTARKYTTIGKMTTEGFGEFVFTLTYGSEYKIRLRHPLYYDKYIYLKVEPPISKYKKRSSISFSIDDFIQKVPDMPTPELIKEDAMRIFWDDNSNKFREDEEYSKLIAEKYKKLRKEIENFKQNGNKEVVEKVNIVNSNNNTTKINNKSIESNKSTSNKLESTLKKDNIKETSSKPVLVESIDKQDDLNEENVDTLVEVIIQEDIVDIYKVKEEEFKNKIKNTEINGDKRSQAQLYEELALLDLLNSQYNKALDNFSKSLSLYNVLKDSNFIARENNFIANTFVYLNDAVNARSYYNKALNIYTRLNMNNEIASIHYNIGGLFENSGRKENAIKEYELALELFSNLNNKDGESMVLDRLGKLYYKSGNNEKAIEIFEQRLKIENNSKDLKAAAASLNDLGLLYVEKKDLDKALDYYNKSVQLKESIKDFNGLSSTFNNIGNLFYERHKYDNSIEYYQKSISLKNETKNNIGLAATLHNLGNSHIKKSENKEAIKAYLQSNIQAKVENNKALIAKNYLALAKAYSNENKYKEALRYYELYDNSGIVLSDEQKNSQLSEMDKRDKKEDSSNGMLMSELDVLTLQNALYKKQITQVEQELNNQKLISLFEAEKNEQHIRLLNEEKKLKDQKLAKRKYFIYFISSLVLALIIFAGGLFSRYISKTKTNKQLNIINQEVIKQKNIVEEKNNEITSSIRYAKRIQTAILPSMEDMKNVLDDFFIFYQPRDIVSGDFYWSIQKDNKSLIAVADCTGHGVPGAFMSLIGIAYLNEIVMDGGITEPAKILDQLREKIKSSLNSTSVENQTSDGMDISLLCFDRNNMTLEYAGANNPLIILRKGDLLQKLPDKMPIGRFLDEEEKPFTNNFVEIEKGDVFYMFSDGFSDQFGGPKGKKYLKRRLFRLFEDIHLLDMKFQNDKVQDEFYTWKGENDQLDDILVMGLRFI